MQTAVRANPQAALAILEQRRHVVVGQPVLYLLLLLGLRVRTAELALIALGVALGIGAANLIGNRNQWPIEISTFWAMLSVGISAAIGIAFGFFPAYKAAQLDPIEALRYE